MKHTKETVDHDTGEIRRTTDSDIPEVLPDYRLPRQPGRYDVIQACEECCVQDFGPSLTQESQTEDADINVIVKRFGLTGQLPQNVNAPQYGDFDQVNDYQSAMNAIRAAESSFNAMPAGIRARFDNDPQKFVEFCSDETNYPQLHEMGLTRPNWKPKETSTPAGATPTPSEPATPPKRPGMAKASEGNEG